VGVIRVLALGCFDGLHIGHLAHLQAARALGDWLIVAVTEDAFVNKGLGRPVFQFEQRCRMLRALRCVDEVVSHRGDSLITIQENTPQVYVKGKEYEGCLPEQECIEHLGVKIIFLDTQPVYSSTQLLNGAHLDERLRSARTCQI